MFRHFQGRFEEEVKLYRGGPRLEAGDPIASNNLAWALSEGLNDPAGPSPDRRV